jgi:hypothetical protein
MIEEHAQAQHRGVYTHLKPDDIEGLTQKEYGAIVGNRHKALEQMQGMSYLDSQEAKHEINRIDMESRARMRAALEEALIGKAEHK